MNKLLILFMLIIYQHVLCQVNNLNLIKNSNEDKKFIFSSSVLLASSSISIINKDFINFIDNDNRYGVGISINVARKVSDHIMLNLNINYINYLWKMYEKYDINKYYISFDLGIKTIFIQNKIRPFLNFAVGSYFLNAIINAKNIVVGTFEKKHNVKTFGIPLSAGLEYINSPKISTQISLRVNNLFPNLEYNYYTDLSLGFNYKF